MPNGKPNILVIWGDDIGITQPELLQRRADGLSHANIDRIANEGMRFTDSYGEQSCTAGRAAFISGQSVYRTGMSKVGIPGADIGWAAEDPTIAELLKPLGYATGQFGKNHLGDMNKHLPTVHGFDEFFGNLYHLNAEEEPEQPDYPHKDQIPEALRAGICRAACCSAGPPTEDSNEPDDPKYGPVGKQRIEDTGPLTSKRMETIDDEIADATVDYIKRQHAARAPRSSCGATSPTCTCAPTPSRRASARPGCWQSPYHDTMIDHDKNVGTGARRARRTRHRRGHHRHLQHRQRPARATRWPDARHDAVPQREEHQLGGRLPGPGDDPLARQDQGGRGVQRDHPAPRLVADLPGRRR